MSTSIPMPTPMPTPMLESDLTTAARFMYESQIQQATNRFLFLDWPNESAQMALYGASMRQMFQDSSNEMYKITNDSGEMIASLVLNRRTYSKGESTVAPASQQPPVNMAALNPAVRPVMRNALIDVQQPMEGIDHIVLSTIFVKPDARRRGLGTQLVKLCMRRAAAEGLPLSLSSVPGATEFYRKLGFKDTKCVDIDLGQWGPEYNGFGIYRLQGMLAS